MSSPTQLDLAKKGRISQAVKIVAASEGLKSQKVSQELNAGHLVVLVNNPRHIKPLGIGKGLRVKVNANIGTSEFCSGISGEMKKLKAALGAGADTVMDLSTGGNLEKILEAILKNSLVPVGTVPIYEAAAQMRQKGRQLGEIPEDLFFEVIEKQAAKGVSFVTVHSGVTRRIIEILKKKPRKMGVVSRGGAILLNWMKKNKKENPLYEKFDRLLKIARKYDLVLSLGDGLRPGCLADATDPSQLEELRTLGRLARRGHKAGVQVIIEGPGHVPLDQIEKNIRLQKKICQGAPFYVLGPLVTDIALGYDHIAGAIGAALAGMAGADFLCYVTPAEHLALPNEDEVREGVVASKIAAHAVDIIRKNPGALKKDWQMSAARKKIDWPGQIKNAIYPPKPAAIYKNRGLKNKNFCSMCGEFCAIKIFKENI